MPRALFAGWFGPVGVGAMYYAMFVQDRTGITAAWPVISLVVGASILAHGISGTPLTQALGRARAHSAAGHASEGAEQAE